MGPGPDGIAQVLEQIERALQWLAGGSDHAAQYEQYRTDSNNISNRGYCPPSGLYRSILVEVSKD